jgi:hypothetical protein
LPQVILRFRFEWLPHLRAYTDGIRWESYLILNPKKEGYTVTQAITINLSDSLYKQLQRAAELSHQPLEAIVEQSLTHSLPPLLEDIPAEYQADIYPLLHMNEAELQQEVNRVFPPNKWTEYELLLNKKRLGSLTASEKIRLDDLRYKADVLTFRKGYAAVLLKRRGQIIPPLQEPGSSS